MEGLAHTYIRSIGSNAFLVAKLQCTKPEKNGSCISLMAKWNKTASKNDLKFQILPRLL